MTCLFLFFHFTRITCCVDCGWVTASPSTIYEVVGDAVIWLPVTAACSSCDVGEIDV